MDLNTFKWLVRCKSGIFAVILILFFQENLVAQDSIYFLNGEQYTGKIVEDLGDYYKIELPVRNGRKIKVFMLDKELIYKVRRLDSTIVIYAPDSANPNDLTVSEMDLYIKGEQLATKMYRPWISPASAFLTGVSGAYLGFWGFTLPAVHLGIQSLYSPGFREKDSGKPLITSDSAFVMGYRDSARKVRNRRMAKCAVAGLLTGWAIKILITGLN